MDDVGACRPYTRRGGGGGGGGGAGGWVGVGVGGAGTDKSAQEWNRSCLCLGLAAVTDSWFAQWRTRVLFQFSFVFLSGEVVRTEGLVFYFRVRTV